MRLEELVAKGHHLCLVDDNSRDRELLNWLGDLAQDFMISRRTEGIWHMAPRAPQGIDQRKLPVITVQKSRQAEGGYVFSRQGDPNFVFINSVEDDTLARFLFRVYMYWGKSE